MARTPDLNELKPVSIAEVAKGPNRTTFDAVAPNLFEVWWKENRAATKSLTRKQLASVAWYACAKSLGVYED